MLVLKIILPIKNIKKLIYYSNNNKKISIGTRVIVPLKNKKMVGIIINIYKKKKIKKKIKKIIKIIDKKKIINTKWIKLIKICSEYYQISFNIFVFYLIPKYIEKKNKNKIKFIKKKHKNKKINKKHKKKKINKKYKKIKINTKYKKIVHKIYKKKKIYLLIANFKKRINFYINIIKKNIQNNYQILFLVPEYYLIKKIKKYIKKKISINIKIINYKLCKKKKIKLWNKTLENKILIIIGTRSAIFTPFLKLNLIIIEEEHSKYYKENNFFFYNTKNIALLRSKIEKIPIILGSLTPSLKSFYKYKKNIYKLIKLNNFKYKIKKKILDINKYKKKTAYFLKKYIYQYIKRKKNIFIYNNIYGYSLIICKNCKTIQKCNLCKKIYILCEKKKKIICYKCNKKKNIKKCIKCKKNKFYSLDFRTKKIKEYLIKIFPLIKIKIINSKKKYTEQILISNKLILNKKIPKPNLIIIFNIDYILHSQNYETIEKFIRIYTLFIEKNYINKKQKIIFLTKYPNNNIFNNFSKKNNYEKNINKILKERKLINYPPYVHESSIFIEYKNNNIYKIYKIMKIILKKHKNINITKPKLIKKKNKYIWQIIILSKLYKDLFNYINKIKKKNDNKTKFKIDIDYNE